jgi:O-6-methylguanine DNA methyltransferase
MVPRIATSVWSRSRWDSGIVVFVELVIRNPGAIDVVMSEARGLLILDQNDCHESVRYTGSYRLRLTSTIHGGTLKSPALLPGSTITLYHAQLRTTVGILHLYSSDDGLRAVTLPNEDREVAEAQLRRRAPREQRDLRIVDDETALHEALAQLAEYFAGDRRIFELVLDHGGTPFQSAVWAELARIPFGETRTYADVARAIGRPSATRAVGAANGSNPIPIVLPFHRVIGSDGQLTGYGGGLPLKARLLAWERGEWQTLHFSLPLGEGPGEGVPWRLKPW